MSATTNDMERNQNVSQWIVSLAISIICCAVLFLVGASYIFTLNEKVTLATVKVELLQARQSQLIAELDALRRPIPVTTNAPAVAPTTVPTPPAQSGAPTAVPVPVPEAPAATTPAAPMTP